MSGDATTLKSRGRTGSAVNRAAALVIVLLLAGCTAKPPEATPTPTVSERDQVLGLLAGLPPPVAGGGPAVTEWETFLTNYPKRDYGTPLNIAASEYLRAELAEAGFRAEMLRFPINPAVGAAAEVRVVRGTLEGADPTHRIGLVSHYDSTQTTTQAAYDDGAGTILQLNICRSLVAAKDVLQRSIDCLFFDAEEEGLLASDAYTAWYKATTDRGFVYDIVFGYDMTGINWPGHAWKLYAFLGAGKAGLGELLEPHADFVNLTLHDFFDGVLPGARDGIEVVLNNPRSSDEAAFQSIGIPSVRFAGGRTAAEYPAYHTPLDTVPYVYQYVGGRANLEKGFDAVLRSSYYLALAFDAYDAADVPAV